VQAATKILLNFTSSCFSLISVEPPSVHKDKYGYAQTLSNLSISSTIFGISKIPAMLIPQWQTNTPILG
jgi:hypothetical protein